MAERRIDNTTSTIPKPNALSGGKVTTSSVDGKVLIYTGTTDLKDVFGDGRSGRVTSNAWIYVPDGTRKIARVLGIYWINEYLYDPDNPSGFEFEYNITLEKAIAGASDSDCFYVLSPVGFSYLNDGGGEISVGDGVDMATVKSGEGDTYSPYEKYSNHPLSHGVLYVDATDSSVFVHEETKP